MFFSLATVPFTLIAHERHKIVLLPELKKMTEHVRPTVPLPHKDAEATGGIS